MYEQTSFPYSLLECWCWRYFFSFYFIFFFIFLFRFFLHDFPNLDSIFTAFFNELELIEADSDFMIFEYFLQDLVAKKEFVGVRKEDSQNFLVSENHRSLLLHSLLRIVKIFCFKFKKIKHNSKKNWFRWYLFNFLERILFFLTRCLQENKN